MEEPEGKRPLGKLSRIWEDNCDVILSTGGWTLTGCM